MQVKAQVVPTLSLQWLFWFQMQTDHEKRLVREAEFRKIASASDPQAAAEQRLPEAAAMYKHQDLSLKQGETIKLVNRLNGCSSVDDL